MTTLNFKGKSIIQNYHLAVKYHELVPDKKKSLTKNLSLNDNLIIHGDNLKALKALLPTYAGKIKCIYIDPPYNTGNEHWIYNDNVNSSMMQEWLGKEVAIDDLTRHDKWLCMMMPRLKLLRELLSDDGAIFISIDENEVNHLKQMMDEIFGEQNLIAIITVKANPRGRQSNENVASLHEYCMCYAKDGDSTEFNGLPLTPEDVEEFDQEDPDGRKWRELGLRQRGAASLREERPDMYYPIYLDPATGSVKLEPDVMHSLEILPRKSNGKDGRWMWGMKKVSDEIDRVYGRKLATKEKFDVFIKDYLDRNGEQRTTKARSMWLDSEVNTELGGKLLKVILGKKTLEYPKPVGLIERILRISTDDNSLILDSFAGSGTTAHAVLVLNKDDGGSRKFILVEMEDYADEITAERVRRVIKGVPQAKDEELKNGLGGTFSYFELGEPIETENILEGDKLPSYETLARYVFYTATGEEFHPDRIDEQKHFIGESKEYEVYLFYKPELNYLKSTALTLDIAKQLGPYNGKKKLVFAPTKYLDLADGEMLGKHGIKKLEFCQLPFEIYKLKE
jgi:adenine-specific DNA-methyltransferase